MLVQVEIWNNLRTVTLAASTGIVFTTSSVIVNNITFEPCINLGSESSVMVTTLDFEKGICMDEIIDADVNKKRLWEDILHHCVRPRLDDVIKVEDSCSVLVIPGRDSTTPGRDATIPDISNAAPKKYRLAFDLSQTVNIAQI